MTSLPLTGCLVVATLLLLNQSADPLREAVPERVGSASKPPLPAAVAVTGADASSPCVTGVEGTTEVHALLRAQCAQHASVLEELEAHVEVASLTEARLTTALDCPSTTGSNRACSVES